MLIPPMLTQLDAPYFVVPNARLMISRSTLIPIIIYTIRFARFRSLRNQHSPKNRPTPRQIQIDCFNTVDG